MSNAGITTHIIARLGAAFFDLCLDFEAFKGTVAVEVHKEIRIYL